MLVLGVRGEAVGTGGSASVPEEPDSGVWPGGEELAEAEQIALDRQDLHGRESGLFRVALAGAEPSAGSLQAPATVHGVSVVHDALLYGSDDELIAAAVPFMRDGLARGDAVVVAVTPSNIDLLREAMGRDADAVRFIDRTEWYVRPTGTVAGWKTEVDGAVGRGHEFVRIIGEVNFGPDGRQASWTRYESVLNRVFADAPAWIVCPYDTRSLPEAILTSAGHTHPTLITRTGRGQSPGYVAPEDYLTAVPEPLPPVVGQPVVALKIGESVAAVRHAVHAAAATGAWLAKDRLGDLLAALSEIVTNSLEHGQGERMLSVWADHGAVVCEVTDQGEGPVDPLAGYRPPSDRANGGMGLWIARQVCDAVCVENIDGVTRVRLAIS
jgi:anti-sigma regulatory factor (Ser/Thr protein kinase)